MTLCGVLVSPWRLVVNSLSHLVLIGALVFVFTLLRKAIAHRDLAEAREAALRRAFTSESLARRLCVAAGGAAEGIPEDVRALLTEAAARVVHRYGEGSGHAS